MQGAISILKNGGVGILPTDTIYGVVGSALLKKTVERIYKLRKRDSKKPMIILISSINELKIFGVNVDTRKRALLKKLWPGPISVILPCREKQFAYLHRGTEALAFRLPKPTWLRRLLKHTGPLVAPSANIAGQKSASIIKEARRYFGSSVDFYIDVGLKRGTPSTLLEIKR
ncbi:threonylcarbamoyl-AMP synthase [Candidatus Jorgensenbacteria bacterium]|nr:threonylcarbamoyl-AMP synthase [Candidatus Jorgensenbacteria bacterium]